MPRPKHTRILRSPHAARVLVPSTELEALTPTQCLAQEELEAMRLVEMEGLTAMAASQSMGVSRHTFGRILTSAREKVARALLLGEAIEVRGGAWARSVPSRTILEEEPHMRIAISAQGPTMDDKVDARFGRAAGFIMVDTETQAVEFLANHEAQQAPQGAGFMVTEILASRGVSVVLTGLVGPKAMGALQAAQIKVVQEMDGQTVAQALEAFKAGETDVLVGQSEALGEPLGQCRGPGSQRGAGCGQGQGRGQGLGRGQGGRCGQGQGQGRGQGGRCGQGQGPGRGMGCGRGGGRAMGRGQ